jgi:hypothetical protein
MAEKNLIVEGLELKYRGMFEAELLLKTVDKYFEERGYIKFEKRRHETTHESGRDLTIELRPYKNITDYEQYTINLMIYLTNVKDVEVVKHNRKAKLQEGEVRMLFDAWVITEYEGRWVQKPWHYLARMLFKRFIHPLDFGKHEGAVSSDCHYVYNNIKSYLNLYKV